MKIRVHSLQNNTELKMSRPVVLGIVGFAVLILITGCSRERGNTAAVPVATPDVPALQLRTLDALRATIDEHYVYEDLAATE